MASQAHRRGCTSRAFRIFRRRCFPSRDRRDDIRPTPHRGRTRRADAASADAARPGPTGHAAGLRRVHPAPQGAARDAQAASSPCNAAAGPGRFGRAHNSSAHDRWAPTPRRAGPTRRGRSVRHEWSWASPSVPPALGRTEPKANIGREYRRMTSAAPGQMTSWVGGLSQSQRFANRWRRNIRPTPPVALLFAGPSFWTKLPRWHHDDFLHCMRCGRSRPPHGTCRSRGPPTS